MGLQDPSSAEVRLISSLRSLEQQKPFLASAGAREESRQMTAGGRHAWKQGLFLVDIQDSCFRSG